MSKTFLESKRRILLGLILIGVLLPQSVLARDVPVALNLRNPDRARYFLFKPYMIKLRRLVQNSWVPTDFSISDKIKVNFEVGSDGSLLTNQVVKSCGNQQLDNSATLAISTVAPFPAPPIGRAETLKIDAVFDASCADPGSVYRGNSSPPSYSQWGQQNGVPPAQQQGYYKVPRTGITGQPNNQPSPPTSDLIESTVPETTDMHPLQTQAADQSQTASNDTQSSPKNTDFTLLTKREYDHLDPDEQRSYRSWLESWFNQPPIVRYGAPSGLKAKSMSIQNAPTITGPNHKK